MKTRNPIDFLNTNSNFEFFSPGKNPTDQYLDGMMIEAPGPINFTMFLTMFGEKLNGTDPEDVIKNAFGCFDEDNTGTKCSFCDNKSLTISSLSTITNYGQLIG